MMRTMTALVLCLVWCAPLAAADIERMFYTRQERALLDDMRENKLRSTVASEEPAAPIPQHVVVNGLVRRSDGKNTVWLNNRATTERRAEPISVTTSKNNDRVSLTVRDSGRSIDLKVGQSAEIVSGTITEGYAKRAAPIPVTKPDGERSTGSNGKTTRAGSMRYDQITSRDSPRGGEKTFDPPDEAVRAKDENSK